jgi:hypothetical protein
MYKNGAIVALARQRQDIERGENFAFLWNGFLILLIGFFIPTPIFIGLLISYVIAGTLLKAYRNEVRAKMFKFFDRVADLLGFNELAPVIQDNRERTHSEPDIHHGYIHRRLRLNSQPITATEKLQRHDESRVIYRRQITAENIINVVQHPVFNNTKSSLYFTI